MIHMDNGSFHLMTLKVTKTHTFNKKKLKSLFADFAVIFYETS